jgi:hypothetical protein
MAQSKPYFNEEQVRITNATALTALSITIEIQKTTDLTFNEVLVYDQQKNRENRSFSNRG